MTTEEIEDAVIAKLSTDVASLAVEPFPENPDGYQLLHPLGAILVQYRGSTFSDPKALGFITQVRTLEFLIVVVVRNLRTHQGAYAHLDALRASLTGYKVGAETSKMYPVREEFIAERGGIWWYGITYRLDIQESE
jgi:hypothetical protein